MADTYDDGTTDDGTTGWSWDLPAKSFADQRRDQPGRHRRAPFWRRRSALAASTPDDATQLVGRPD